MLQIFKALTYCHSLGIMHRDLKLENILLEKGRCGELYVKIIDFGTAITFHKTEKPATQVVGTPYYVSPDVLHKDYNEKCDIWSCGIILYVILSGKPPFDGIKNKHIVKAILKNTHDYNDEVWDHFSDDVKDFITILLDKDKETRPSAFECIHDRWI